MPSFFEMLDAAMSRTNPKILERYRDEQKENTERERLLGATKFGEENVYDDRVTGIPNSEKAPTSAEPSASIRHPLHLRAREGSISGPKPEVNDSSRTFFGLASHLDEAYESEVSILEPLSSKTLPDLSSELSSLDRSADSATGLIEGLESMLNTLEPPPWFVLTPQIGAGVGVGDRGRGDSGREPGQETDWERQRALGQTGQGGPAVIQTLTEGATVSRHPSRNTFNINVSAPGASRDDASAIAQQVLAVLRAQILPKIQTQA